MISSRSKSVSFSPNSFRASVGITLIRVHQRASISFSCHHRASANVPEVVCTFWCYVERLWCLRFGPVAETCWQAVNIGLVSLWPIVLLYNVRFTKNNNLGHSCLDIIKSHAHNLMENPDLVFPSLYLGPKCLQCLSQSLVGCCGW